MRFGSSVQEATISGELPTWSISLTALHACTFYRHDVARAGAPRANAWCWCRAARPKIIQRSNKPAAVAGAHATGRYVVYPFCRAGNQITNVLRCLRLETCGYDITTVTELVGWEHSMKN
jgi:hypothetical protein